MPDGETVFIDTNVVLYALGTEDQLTILNPFVAGGLDVDANRIS